MATVANNPADDSRSVWLIMTNLVVGLVCEARRTWFCTSWVPFIRYVLTIIIVIIGTLVLCSGFAYLLLRAAY